MEQRITPEYIEALYNLPNDLGMEFVGCELEAVPEVGIPFWAAPWRYDGRARHQAKLDRQAHKRMLDEAGLSDETSEEEEYLSSLTDLGLDLGHNNANARPDVALLRLNPKTKFTQAGAKAGLGQRASAKTRAPNVRALSLITQRDHWEL